MLFGRRRRREGLNVFIVFTDLLFVMVFILILHILAQGLAARSSAEASLSKQREAVNKALGSLKPIWKTGVCQPYQHESLQRIPLSGVMTFQKSSADIDVLPSDISKKQILFTDRSGMLLALAKGLRKAEGDHASSTIEIQGFSGPGDNLSDIAIKRAQNVMEIFRRAGFPGYRLMATAYGEALPQPYGYDGSDPSKLPGSVYDRRVEILIISRRVAHE